MIATLRQLSIAVCLAVVVVSRGRVFAGKKTADLAIGGRPPATQPSSQPADDFQVVKQHLAAVPESPPGDVNATRIVMKVPKSIQGPILSHIQPITRSIFGNPFDSVQIELRGAHPQHMSVALTGCPGGELKLTGPFVEKPVDLSYSINVREIVNGPTKAGRHAAALVEFNSTCGNYVIRFDAVVRFGKPDADGFVHPVDADVTWRGPVSADEHGPSPLTLDRHAAK